MQTVTASSVDFDLLAYDNGNCFRYCIASFYNCHACKGSNLDDIPGSCYHSPKELVDSFCGPGL
jgi:hypothetical protein